MRKLLLFLGAIAAVLGLAALPAAAGTHPKPGQGSLTIVHGIPNLPVDIYLNKKLALAGVTFSNYATVKLPAGQVRVDFKAAGTPANGPSALIQHVGIKRGVSKSLVAHLSATGTPRTSVFYNNTTKAGQQAQVTVRHTAAAPAVDVYVNGAVAIPGLANPNQAKAFVPGATYTVKVTAAGNPSVVALPDTPLPLAAKTNTIVYAVGDFAGGSFTVIVQVLPLS
jgi:hypothetical protein